MTHKFKVGQRVKTTHGKGTIINPIGGPPDKYKPILIKLDKPIGMYTNFYYSKDEIELILTDKT